MIKYTNEDVVKSDNDAGYCSGKNFDEGSYYCQVGANEVRPINLPVLMWFYGV